MQRTDFQSAIEARDLRRTFVPTGSSAGPPVDAVRGVSFDVAPGELVAFLGPNGAGKSTTVKMLTTLLPPSAGTARIAGHDVVREGALVRRMIGYVGQGTSSGPYHRVRDELITQGLAQRMTRSAATKQADTLLGVLELEATADRLASTLSGGQKRRLDVALGLVHTPAVLFLDEPTTGLDPQSRANLWKHLLALRVQFGMTIFLTTHYLDEADAMAERILVIDRGTVIANDTPARLKSELAGDRLRVELADATSVAVIAELAEQLPAARDITIDGRMVWVTVGNGEGALPAWLRAVHARGLDVTAASVRRPTLDDVFFGLTGRSLREEAR